MSKDVSPTPAVPGAMAMTDLADKLERLRDEATAGEYSPQKMVALQMAAAFNIDTIIAALRDADRLRAQVREGDGVRYWLEQICAIATEPRANVGPAATHKELQDALRKIRELSGLALAPQPAPTEGGKG